MRVSPHLVGDSPTRRHLLLAVVGLLLLASAAFVLGVDVGLSFGWIALTLGIAIVAGYASAGLVPTVGSLWLVGLWWFAFPPLVGYLTDNWADSARYHHPRTLAYAHGSARGELLSGIEYGLQFGLVLAVVLGLTGYVTGRVIGRTSTRTSPPR